MQFHLEHHYSINASEMGLGKSRMALAAAKATGGMTLVIGPAGLRRTWELEGEKVGQAFRFIPYSMIHKERAANLKDFKFWIADEAHYLKNPTTRRTQAFYQLLKELRPDYLAMLTGTPLKNRVPDFWTLLAFCCQNQRGTSGERLEGNLAKYHGFARHFCDVVEMRVGGRRIAKYTGVRTEKLPELRHLLKGKMIRFLVKDVLTELPPITRKDVPLEIMMPAGEEESLLGTFEAYLGGRKSDIKAKTASAAIKAPATAAYCAELREGGSGPLLIFSDHVESTETLAKALGGLAVTGKTPPEERGRIVERFQRGEIEILAATIGSLSVGVTLTAARHVVFNDLSWVPADNLQAEKRIHRIGQKDACFAHYIETTPTDRYIKKTLFEKLETIQRVMA